jgi:hypothetical protein
LEGLRGKNKRSQDNRSPGGYFKSELPEYDAEVLAIEPSLPVKTMCFLD